MDLRNGKSPEKTWVSNWIKAARGRLRATFSTAEIAAFSRVTKAAINSQRIILHAVVPRKRHRQNTEVATGWPRGGLAPPNVKTAAFFEGAAGVVRNAGSENAPLAGGRGRLRAGPRSLDYWIVVANTSWLLLLSLATKSEAKLSKTTVLPFGSSYLRAAGT